MAEGGERMQNKSKRLNAKERKGRSKFADISNLQKSGLAERFAAIRGRIRLTRLLRLDGVGSSHGGRPAVSGARKTL